MPGQKRKRKVQKEDLAGDDDGFVSPDISEDSDSGEDDDRHERLLASVAALQGSTRKKKVTRSQASKDISEFSLRNTNMVDTNAILKGIEKSTAHSGIRKKLSRVNQENKTVKKPLTKPQAERALRSAAYDAASEDISKWQPIVKKNREAKQIDLRNEHVYPAPKSVGQFYQENFNARDEFEAEMVEMMKDPKASNKIGNDGLTLTERQLVESLTIEEAKQRRAELQKNRALLSYYERKCARQNKIKSKSYHRIKRKEREGKAERAKERGTLKHQNTSKWAKNLKIRNHKDPTTRQLLSDNLKRGGELMQKEVEDIEPQSSEDETETPVDDNEADLEEEPDLEDTAGAGEEELVQISGEDSNAQISDDDDDEDADEDEDEDDDGNDGERSADSEETDSDDVSAAEQDQEPVKAVAKPKEQVDLNEDLIMAGAGEEEDEEEFDDDEDNKRGTIAEAFASADVVAAFASEKAADIAANKPKVVDNFLPGWGDWAGEGVSMSSKAKRRRRRFVSHQKPGKKGEQRADQKLAKVIISKKRNKHIEKHQPQSVPFPFQSKEQYQSSMRMPIGREWHTEQSFRDVCQPKVLTHMGELIQPIKAPKKLKA